MSYQVLARKWRPQTFHETVGQEHVLRALINALDHDRLHHAYLFTGTRGVGKTTIARILARCLNCEQGVSSRPCGTCPACREISEGRFVDLIEVDAASRTRVEDTRELLDNVQYTPTRGRYKVYLIDEVHMLSVHSFNALLKTLEEPPPHVKFLFATTDPQRLPATILSRCLQFHLKNMTPEAIVGHLRHVLDEEGVEADEAALGALARVADGSMRDALSLTDQAVAFGGGRLRREDVQAMLGAIDPGQILELVTALANADAAAVLAAVDRAVEYGADGTQLLDELVSTLHRIAVAQVVPGGAGEGGDAEQLAALAEQLTAEEVQLYYQLGLMGRRDLPLAVDARSGVEMALLRMLAFRPQGVPEPPERPLPGASPPGPVQEAAPPPKKPEAAPTELLGAAAPEPGPSSTAAQAPVPAAPTEVARRAIAAPETDPDPVEPRREQPPAAPDDARPAEPPPTREPAGEAPRSAETSDCPWADLDEAGWIQLVTTLKVGGVAGVIAGNCWLRGASREGLDLVLDEDQASVYDPLYRDRLAEALAAHWGQPVTLHIEAGQPGGETPAVQQQRRQRERLARARAALEQDPNVQLLRSAFAATLNEDSIQPL